MPTITANKSPRWDVEIDINDWVVKSGRSIETILSDEFNDPGCYGEDIANIIIWVGEHVPGGFTELKYRVNAEVVGADMNHIRLEVTITWEEEVMDASDALEFIRHAFHKYWIAAPLKDFPDKNIEGKTFLLSLKTLQEEING